MIYFNSLGFIPPPPPPSSMMDEFDAQNEIPLPPPVDDTYDVPPTHQSYETPGYQAGFLTATALYQSNQTFFE